MAEPHRFRRKLDEASRFGGNRGLLDVDASLVRSAPQYRPVSADIGCRDQQERPRVRIQSCYLASEPVGEPWAYRQRPGNGGATGQLIGAELRAYLYQSHRVTLGMGEYAINHPVVHRRPDDGLQQLAGFCRRQTVELQRRELVERVRLPGFAEGDHHPDAVRVEPARHERQHAS